MEYNSPSLTEINPNKRVRDDSEDTESDSPEAKRIRDGLFDILDDTYLVVDRNQDLASVMKSFEEEISIAGTQQQQQQLASELTLTPTTLSDSAESQPDLGYLLEASDDELGLPPTISSLSSGEEEKNDDGDGDGDGEDLFLSVSSEAVGWDKIWGFDDDIQSYESIGYAIGGVEEENNNGEYVALEGLFDYSDGFSGNGSDFSDSSWRPEFLPAQ